MGSQRGGLSGAPVLLQVAAALGAQPKKKNKKSGKAKKAASKKGSSNNRAAKGAKTGVKGKVQGKGKGKGKGKAKGKGKGKGKGKKGKKKASYVDTVTATPAPYVHSSMRSPAGTAATPPKKPWERNVGADQQQKVQETTEWLKQQRKKLLDGFEAAKKPPPFDPVKVAAERKKNPPKGDPLLDKLRSMGETRGRGLDGVMEDKTTTQKKSTPPKRARARV